MNNEQRVVTHATLEALLAEVVDLALDGWQISDEQPGEAMLFNAGYQVVMVRSNASVNAFKARAEAVQERPKLTPRERMAYARAQRGKGKLDLSSVVAEE